MTWLSFSPKVPCSDWRRRMTPYLNTTEPLRWRHNGHNSVSNHQPHHCLLNRLFRRRSKKISKLRVTGLCVGNSPGTGEFPAQMTSYAESVSIWWRHHDTTYSWRNTSRPNAVSVISWQILPVWSSQQLAWTIYYFNSEHQRRHFKNYILEYICNIFAFCTHGSALIKAMQR